MMNFKLFRDLILNGLNVQMAVGYPLNFLCTSGFCVQFQSLDQVKISPQKMRLSICLILSGVKLTNWGHPFFT